MDEQNRLVSITVLIAGRPYPLKIKAGDEPTIRKIVKEINDQINNFQLKYTTKDKQDCLTMVALTYAVELAKSKSTEINAPADSSVENSALLNQLSILDTLLDNALHGS